MSEKMNIVFVANVPFNSVGGRLQRFAEELRKKYNIFWIDPPASDSYDSKEMNDFCTDNIVVYKTPAVKGGILAKTWQKEKFAIDSVASILQVYKRLDVVVVFDGWGTMLLRRYLKLKKIPFVFDYVDRMHLFSKGFKRKAHWLMIKDAIKTADYVTASSVALFEDAMEIKKRRCKYIPNGAPIMKAPPKKKNKHFTVGYVGAFGEWVDFDTLVPVIPAMNNVDFVFVGGGAQEERVKYLSETCQNVKYRAPIKYKDVPKMIQSFDVCIIPFHKNDITDAVCPLKLFEYWSLKKPVLCKKTAELDLLIPDDVFFETPKELESRLIELMENPKLRKELGKRGYNKFMAQHTFKKLAEDFENVLLDASPAKETIRIYTS